MSDLQKVAQRLEECMCGCVQMAQAMHVDVPPYGDLRTQNLLVEGANSLAEFAKNKWTTTAIQDVVENSSNAAAAKVAKGVLDEYKAIQKQIFALAEQLTQFARDMKP